jgi:hypothetical protein
MLLTIDVGIGKNGYSIPLNFWNKGSPFPLRGKVRMEVKW